MKLERLDGVHPMLVDKIGRVLAAMTALGFPMIVTDGLRTTVQQQLLYAQGRTRPGKVVTNADGIMKRSNHQQHTDMLGHAVDCCFLDETGAASWDARYPWHAYGAAVEAVGLIWGGSWKSIVDLPHAELPDAA